ncbi:unnamed protein product [Clonostachys rosea f. rosea IK726]|uniref:Uncharacterized protein n=2 Tax=Bionectria ochroleuca TaxID=29856 RepID=A0A0B7KJI1_BIOOC|nr:unnamed protein product [Clonostachys rosea f. rosea IK726]
MSAPSGDPGGSASHGDTSEEQGPANPTGSLWYNELDPFEQQDDDDGSDDQYEPSESNEDDHFLDAHEELDEARGVPYTREQILEFLRRSNLRAVTTTVNVARGTPWHRFPRFRSRPPRDPNRFPKVPSEAGTRLMFSGQFGTNNIEMNYNRRMNKSIQRRLLERELGLGSYDDRRRNNDLITQSLVPSGNKADMIIHYEEPVYSGQYSADGNFFFACGKDYKVRLYDTSRPYNWRHYKTVTHPWGRWTLTDASLSKDNKWLAYTSITSLVAIAPTDINDTGDPYALDLSGGNSDTQDYWGGGFGGIWSVRFSGDGRELVAGTNRNAIVIYDIESRRVLHQVRGHDDDVNAVCFADESSPHIIYSGSDDSTLKGLTYIDSKGDGRYILSNGKDQSMKLWDLRMMMSTDRFRGLDPSSVSRFSGFDYRSGHYSDDDWDVHPHDNSVVTFRGHRVLNTLIRCHFPPPNSTNSRYVYTGSSDGKVYIYNIDATVASVINVSEATKDLRPTEGFYRGRHWNSCVRDASWHPHAPMIVASAWNGHDLANGTCTLHSFNDGVEGDEGEPELPMHMDSKLKPITLAERNERFDRYMDI